MTRQWTALIVLALAGLMLRAPAATPAEYDHALARVQTAMSAQIPALRVGEAPASGAAPSFVADRVLGPILSVERPGGATQPVEAQTLIAAIKEAEHRRDLKKRVAAYQALGRQIAELRRDVTMASAVSAAPSQQESEREARRVLSEPAFQSDPLPGPTAAERFWNWVSQQWAKLHLPAYHGPTPAINPLVPKAIIIVLAAGVLALLVYLLVQLIRHRGPRAQPLALDEAESALVEARATSSLLSLAEQQARAGDHRRAFRLVYLATLVALDSSSILRFDRSQTNWEYLRALRAAGRDDLSQALMPLTRRFDRIWYGYAPASAADYAEALREHQRLTAPPQAIPAVR